MTERLLRFPPFPPSRRPAVDTGALQAFGITLRAASLGDLPELAGLYAQLRLPELLFHPWSQAEKHAFVDEQFRLQHHHFVRHYRRADFWILLRDDVPIGRLYLDRSTSEWRIIDILLATVWRARGLGSKVIAWVQQGAAAAGARSVALSVAVDNRRAHLLYTRLGFTDVDAGDGLHQPMRWRVPSAPSA
ncbi:GNAT family N-acetyltransferase [uncultured Sphingomonas sp.]|uniref:GNAT family N-acetyltransferase n=1 Tax=uncultured Sphingomonas sp. TaxID=158754 RepID=UPI0025EF2016|nr:GNAT family N-acetyltransferase [uncultured Sphingomonas sp.]